MIRDLVHVVGERIRGMRALVHLHQHVALDRDDVAAAAADAHRHVVFPLDLVAYVVLVARRAEPARLEVLVGYAEWNRADLAEELGSGRITAVLVAERAPAAVDRRMPGRVAEPIGSNREVLIVGGRAARVRAARGPDSERDRVADDRGRVDPEDVVRVTRRSDQRRGDGYRHTAAEGRSHGSDSFEVSGGAGRCRSGLGSDRPRWR